MAITTVYVAPEINPKTRLGSERLRQLQRDGFCVIRGMADEPLLELTRACAERAIATQGEERLAQTLSPGTLIDSDAYPELADIIGNAQARGHALLVL